jgi:diguanylate cyclase (GGDEF)-like protein/PAS domain S-box-containing protein
MKAPAQEKTGDVNPAVSFLSKSPALIFFIIALTVFAAEAMVMLLLPFLPQLSPMGEAITDAALLVVLISPTLYSLLFRSMVAHIRERRKMEEALRENEEEQFKVMIRTSLDGFLITDVRGHFMEVNDAYCQMLGYSREELLNMSVPDVEAIETPEETARHITKILETGNDRFETRQRHKDGHILNIGISANHSNLHGGGFYSFLRDITERKRAEEELKLRAQILNSISDTIFLLDLDLNFVYLNEAAWKSRGYTRDEMMGMNLRTLNAPEYNGLLAPRMQTLMENGQGFFESAHRCKDGAIMPVEINARIIDSGGRKLLLSVIRDITERKQDEEKLRMSEARLQATLDNSPYMIWQKDPEGRYIACNQAFIKASGKNQPQDVLGKTDFDLWPEELAEKYRTDDIEIMLSRQQKVLEERAVADGHEYWVETCKTPIMDKNGQLFGTTGFAQDITERKRSEDMLRENEARLKELFENLSSGVAVYRASPDGRDFTITAFNRAAERIEKMSREDLLGKNVAEVFPGIAEFGLLEVFRHVWGSGAAEHFPVSFYQDGRIASWRENYVNKLPNGEIVAIYDDITKEKQAEEQMHRLAHYDALTGLPNRTLFADRLRQSLATAKRDKAHIALMFLDLDKFKPVNDTLGHDVGDLLLNEAAKRMQNCVRESDTVSRVGGDEFVVLLPAVETEQDAMRVAEKILYALNQPFELAGHSIGISASIGVAVYPDHGSDEKMLIKNADIAMYYAKGGGRNNVKLYQPGMENAQ